MALLNEKQIEEVVYIFLNNRDTNAVVIKSAIENWNEKQLSTQFEPDWSKAPEGAKNAVLEFWWLDINGNKIEDKKWEVLNKPC